MPGIASSAPAVLLAHLASLTERIRLGSGGVMLPNHAPLVIAEQFGMLEALHPGRIDLGIGRAPGTDPRTAAALAPHAEPPGAGPPRAARRALRVLQRHVPRGPPLPRDHGRARRGGTSRRSGCSDRATTAPGSPACSGCRSRSPTTSPPPTRCPPSRCTGAASDRRPMLAEPYVMLGVAVLCADDSRAGGLPQPSPATSRSSGCARVGRVRSPPPRRPRPSTRRRTRRSSSARGPSPASSATPRRWAPTSSPCSTAPVPTSSW